MNDLFSPEWDSQPQQFAPLDTANPLANGLAFLVNPGCSGTHDIVRDKIATENSTVRRASTAGISIGTTASSGLGAVFGTPGAVSAKSTAVTTSTGNGLGDFAYFVYGNLVASSAREILVGQACNNSAGAECYVVVNANAALTATSGRIAFSAYPGTGFNVGIDIAFPTDGKFHLFEFSRSGTTLSAYIDGVLVASVSFTVTISSPSLGESDFVGGYIAAGFGALSSNAVLLGAYNRALTQSERTSFSDNPWQLLEKPQTPPLFGVAATGTGYALTAATTSFAVTGSATGLKADRRLTATTATFGVTGNAAGLKRSYALQATQASYALTGNAVAMLAARRLAAAVASYSLTGTATGLNASRRLSVSAAAYTLSGQTAALSATRRLAAVVGTYTLTGIDVVLTKSTARTLTAVAGAYAVTGQAAGLKATRRMAADVASFGLSGGATALARGFRLAAVNGSFALTGQNVAFRYSRRMAIEPGLFALTGNAITMMYTGTAIVYARAPAGSGYAPRRDERQSRPRSGNTTRPSNTQRNNR